MNYKTTIPIVTMSKLEKKSIGWQQKPKNYEVLFLFSYLYYFTFQKTEHGKWKAYWTKYKVFVKDFIFLYFLLILISMHLNKVVKDEINDLNPKIASYLST